MAKIIRNNNLLQKNIYKIKRNENGSNQIFNK